MNRCIYLQSRRMVYLLLGCFMVLASEQVAALAQSAGQPFTLHIADEYKPHRAGSQVFIEITQTNVSKHRVNGTSVNVASTDMTYEYSITDSSGYRLQPRKNMDTLPQSVGFYTLAPGESRSGGFLLSFLYDLSRPGTYTVQVSRTIHPKEVVVKSNTRTIDITE